MLKHQDILDATPRDKPYKLPDRNGLHVLVVRAKKKPGGVSKLFRFKYRLGGKERALALGVFPATSLKDAREAVDDARQKLRNGIDPAAERQLAKHAAVASVDAVAEASRTTFEAVAREWYAKTKKSWTPRHAGYILRRMEGDLFPQIGAVPIKQLDALMVLDALRKVEKRGALEMARRCRQYVSATCRYAIVTRRATHDPAADLKDALEARPPARHLAALAESDLPGFFRKLASYDGEKITQLATRMLMLTAVRTSELLGARWDEIDLKAAQWVIPAARMKMRLEHVVPLSTQAIALLRELRKMNPESEILFPSTRNERRTLSNNTILYGLYRLGFHGRATGHGMRSLFSTVLNEHQFEADWIETQLAHVPEGVRARYNRAKWLPQRVKMMQWWGDRLAAIEAGKTRGKR